VFAVDSALWQVHIDGSEPARVAWAAPGITGWPSFLPSGAGGWSSPAVLVSAGTQLHAVEVSTGDARALEVTANGQGAYARGFLISTEQTGAVRAVPFDVEGLRPTGSSISVIEDVFRPNLTDATLLALSTTGTVAYVPGTSQRRVVLVDRAGRETSLPFPPGAYRGLAVSPDGLRVLIDRRGEGLRILDLATGRDNPTAGQTRGVWSPGGDEIIVATGPRQEFLRSSTAPGAQPVVLGRDAGFPAHWGSDGILLTFTLNPRQPLSGALRMRRVEPDAVPEDFINTDGFEHLITRSPDGRWVAYTSDFSGRMEVYARPFAGGETRQISDNGAVGAVFSRDGSELFYASGEDVYSVRTDRLAQPGPLGPELLFTRGYVFLGPSWDVRPQGDFVMVSAGANWLREILVVQNWTTELEELFAEETAR
jgi:hypothetical protein